MPDKTASVVERAASVVTVASAAAPRRPRLLIENLIDRLESIRLGTASASSFLTMSAYLFLKLRVL
ncbi:unnamed protein product [Nippostrongylus brasiliensis]|uniref:Uncharacterized protein n=1 Tax=Nippostrongylus brasiliensis TaxID=27835 RepID=A0A0N4Y371_NIPBR|nr:unnamed protein product [Nippostrongylus brasiliensis]